jgi:hypothetical protein
MHKHVSALAIVAVVCAPAFALAQPQVNIDLTPEAQAYQARTDARIRSWIHEDNREASDEERAFITEHWRRSARLWRIRRLANEAHDAAAVARVDQLLLRADGILEHQLMRMRAHAPVMQYAPGAIEVVQAPPAPEVEVQGNPPGPGQVWTPGYWHWNGNRHVWMHGSWAAPPQAGMIYEPARWENRNGRYFFNDGRWRVGAQPAANVVYEPPPPPPSVVEVQMAPPQPLVEVRPPPPPGGVWIPGYWNWNGQRHVWLSGRWSAGRPNMHWEPDHWVRTPNNGWRQEHGHWAR